MASFEQAFPLLNTPLVDSRSGIISIPWYQFLIALWNRTGGAQGGATIPTGGIIYWPTSVPPDGYLLCNGVAINRQQNAGLFGVIGVTFGAGDGVTTFNLPNGIDRVFIGAGGLYAVGATGGNTSITIGIANMPAHTHGVTDPGHTHLQDAHAHVQQVVSNNTAGTAGSQGANAANTTSVGTTDLTTAVNQSAFTGISIDLAGGGDPLDSLPPFLALFPMIKT